MKISVSSLTSAAFRRAAFALSLAGLLAATLFASGCLFTKEKGGEEGVVRSDKAKLYSSTALVALEVGEVKRGDRVVILQRQPITGPTYTEDWLQVRLKEHPELEGWVEARHVVSQTIVDATAKIAGKADESPAIAAGRLKVRNKLRLEPRRDADVATVLTRGTEFEIIGKELVKDTTQKAKPKPGVESPDAETATASDPDAEDDEDSHLETWYRVRMTNDAIIHGGYLLAQTVSLEVPDEILHLEGEGRRFVAWQVVSTVRDSQQGEKNNYVTFMRRGGLADEIDFERVYCLFWDPASHQYYAPYVDSDLRGNFPISVTDRGGSKIVTFNVLNDQDKPAPVEIEVSGRDRSGRLTVKRVTPPIKGERIVRRR